MKKAARLQGDGLPAGKAKEGANVMSTRAFAARENRTCGNGLTSARLLDSDGRRNREFQR